MAEIRASGIRGFLINTHQDGRFVFRVYGDPDPGTGHPSFRDYRLRVDDLEVTIVSDYYALFDDGSGEPDRLDYASPPGE